MGKKILTRTSCKFGGGPCELPKTDPFTFRQIIQHYYYLETVYPELGFSKVDEWNCRLMSGLTADAILVQTSLI